MIFYIKSFVFNIKCHYFTIKTLFFHIKVCVQESCRIFLYQVNAYYIKYYTYIYFKFACVLYQVGRGRVLIRTSIMGFT